MVKVFTPNKNGKIEFTKKELEELLNEVWRDGYNSNNNYYWRSPWTYTDTITTPKIEPIVWSVTTNSTDDKITYTAQSNNGPICINQTTESITIGE